MRRLALDIGSKRIGIAVSDLTGLYAFPLTTILRKNISDDIDKIYKLLIEKENVKKVNTARTIYGKKAFVEFESVDVARDLATKIGML